MSELLGRTKEQVVEALAKEVVGYMQELEEMKRSESIDEERMMSILYRLDEIQMELDKLGIPMPKMSFSFQALELPPHMQNDPTMKINVSSPKKWNVN